MALTDPCKVREPRVINNELIKKCIDYQYPKGELGRLMREEGLPIEEIREIRFEFMNLIKIDHLWMLKSLTKLQLNNNYIEKIENIEMLIHLKELDFSFNKITKIENLDTLVNIETLTFFDNLIEKIENMNMLSKLTIFSIGRNKISEKEEIIYLRKFNNLVSLNMAHNPCSDNLGFRAYVAAFLPKIVYYEYKKISEQERKEGLTIHEKAVENLEKTEYEEYAKIAKIEQERADAERHSSSFVEYLNTSRLFDTMFEGDDEGKALLTIGEDVEEFYTEFQTQFLETCMQVFELGQRHYEIRTTEFDQFNSCVTTAKLSNQKESIEHMEAFIEKKDELFDQVRELQKLRNDDEMEEVEYQERVDDIIETFNKIVHDTWKKLMKLELELFEQLEEVYQTFEHNITDMINVFIEECQGGFTNIRGLENTYNENISDVAGRYITNANLGEFEIPESLETVMADKEALNNAISATHDLHLQIIDNREDVLMGRARKWLDTLIETLNTDEINRNRYKILEVNHFLDIQREEFETLTADKRIKVGSEDLDFIVT